MRMFSAANEPGVSEVHVVVWMEKGETDVEPERSRLISEGSATLVSILERSTVPTSVSFSQLNTRYGSIVFR